MRRRAPKLALALALLALGGCGWGRQVYRALTRHRLISVPSEGMVPTIKPGDRAAVDGSYYSERPVRRFDVVTYKLSPEHFSEVMVGMDGNASYVGRVVGLGGETLEIKGGRVHVDGRPLGELFATVPADAGEVFGPVRIPAGEVFVMGDNRPNSLDGRHWARPTLKKQNIDGKVIEIFPR